MQPFIQRLQTRLKLLRCDDIRRKLNAYCCDVCLMILHDDFLDLDILDILDIPETDHLQNFQSIQNFQIPKHLPILCSL